MSNIVLVQGSTEGNLIEVRSIIKRFLRMISEETNHFIKDLKNTFYPIITTLSAKINFLLL